MSAVVASVGGFTAAGALAHSMATAPPVVGSAAAGKSLFVPTCGVCHTLQAAGTVGTIGPNLTTAAASLTETTIIDAITNGGATVMTPAAVAKYTTQMVPYKSVFTTTQIENIAAYVYTSTHAAVAVTAKPLISTFTPARGKAGTKLTVAGTNLIGATSVRIGTLKMAFKVVSATKITATVPTTAKSGRISVTTNGGTATSLTSFMVA